MKEEIILNKQKFATMMQISKQAQIELSVGQCDLDFIMDRLTYMLKIYLWGEDLGNVIFETPLNWWEAVKERWFPSWLSKRYPVKYKRVYCKATAIYPQLNLPSLTNEPHITILKYNGEDND
jgi:hypothetical protein